MCNWLQDCMHRQLHCVNMPLYVSGENQNLHLKMNHDPSDVWTHQYKTCHKNNAEISSLKDFISTAITTLSAGGSRFWRNFRSLDWPGGTARSFACFSFSKMSDAVGAWVNGLGKCLSSSDTTTSTHTPFQHLRLEIHASQSRLPQHCARYKWDYYYYY